jgi:hypothetical protein
MFRFQLGGLSRCLMARLPTEMGETSRDSKNEATPET